MQRPILVDWRRNEWCIGIGHWDRLCNSRDPFMERKPFDSVGDSPCLLLVALRDLLCIYILTLVDALPPEADIRLNFPKRSANDLMVLPR